MEEMILKNLSQVSWTSILAEALLNPKHLPAILSLNHVNTSELKNIARNAAKSEPYGRQVLYRSPDIEVMLAKWAYQTPSSPHNHGFSKGLIWFVQGDFQEQHFKFKNGQLIEENKLATYRENDVAVVNSNDIHSSCAVTEGLSLHLYSPAIQEMKVWDLKNKQTLTVADECGAWVPENKNLILKRVKWA